MLQSKKERVKTVIVYQQYYCAFGFHKKRNNAENTQFNVS